mgnify:CR=1 FL=1|tara:strand:- start:2984 stop:4015 length:1032 start_codon:yes stop_codon:yes gene_type:complete
MEIDINKDNIHIKKVLKYYLKLKNKKNDNDGVKLANHVLLNLSKIKTKDKYNDILKETEEYCNNYIKNTVDEKNEKNITYKKLIEIIKSADIINIKKYTIKNEFLYKFDDEGLTPLHLCIKLGDTSILKYLLNNNISVNTINKKGYTLLEYACLNKDPNMIHFLIDHGSIMKKNIFLRDKDIKIQLKTNNIDVACVFKIMLMNSYKKELKPEIESLKKYLNFDELCGLGNFTLRNILIGIGHSLNKESLDNYILIVEEELLDYGKNNLIFCYQDKKEVIVYNLIPFINYKFNISQENVFMMELYYLKKKFNKKDLVTIIFEKYINKLAPEKFIGLQVKKVLNI